MLPLRIYRYLINTRIKRIPYDSHISRIRSLVVGEGMLHEGNIFLMDFAIKNMPTKGVVFEIGSYGGLSTNLLTHLLRKNNRNEIILSCDPWIYEGYKDSKGIISDHIDGRKDISRVSYHDYMKNNFIRSTKFLNGDKLPFSFNMEADKFFKEFEKNSELTDVFNRKLILNHKISFGYIDGNHSYESVKKDFLNIDKHLLKSGYILFDDSMDTGVMGSSKFMKEMKRNKDYKLIYKNPQYLFQKL